MLQSEVEEHVNNWPQLEERVYKYRLAFNLPHIVTLTRKGEIYECVEAFSTFKTYSPIKAEQLIKEISSTRLIYIELLRWSFDPVKFRTGGCDCGAVFTSEPDLHYKGCYLRNRM